MLAKGLVRKSTSLHANLCGRRKEGCGSTSEKLKSKYGSFCPYRSGGVRFEPRRSRPRYSQHDNQGRPVFYKDATRPLFREEELFDLSSENLNILIKLLKERAEQYNWIGPGGIAMVPENPAAAAGPEVNVITQYGEKTLDELRLWEQTYIPL